MQLNFAFRLSLYVTLALATLCLGYAELPFLPEISAISLVVFALLFVAFFLEGRWSLSIPAANVVGGVITAALGAWFAYQFLRPTETRSESDAPWPASLLPYLGPVLMVAMTAKLARPKHVGDFWAMQLIGLALVALASALASDALFAALFALYFVAGVWSLTLFYLYRATYRDPGNAITAVSPASNEDVNRYASETVLVPSFRFPTRVPWLGSAARWVLGVSGASLILFLLTPRSPSSNWELANGGKKRFEVGYSNEANIDMTRTGTLGVTNEVAFEFDAKDADGLPKTDMPFDTRFRGRVLRSYAQGNWRFERHGNSVRLTTLAAKSTLMTRTGPPRLLDAMPIVITASLPNFGPDQFFLTFRLGQKVQGEVLYDPVKWVADRPVPIVSHLNGQSVAWVHHSDDSFTPVGTPPQPSPIPYTQVVVEPIEPNFGPLMRVERSSLEYLVADPWQRRELRGIEAYTDRLVERFVAEGELPPDARLKTLWGSRPVEFHRQIAKQLCEHLSSSGEFTYSLKIQRNDKSIDPIEDFLLNVKSGHCNRYASALALMLRSQGIPAQLVVGFRGCTNDGDGKYRVFQHDTHAWVEALIEETVAPAGMDDDGSRWRWMSLDATPEGGDAEPAASGWLSETGTRGETFFRDFIVGYNAERRQKTAKALWTRLKEIGSAANQEMSTPRGIASMLGAGLLLVAAVVLARRRSRGRWPSSPSAGALTLGPTVAFQRRLLAILQRGGWVPSAGQTAREFATGLVAELPAEVAHVPVEVAEAYYRAKFGGDPPNEPELQRIAERLDALEAALHREPQTAIRK